MDKNKRKKIIKRILLSLLAIGLLGGLILSGALIYEYYYHSYLPQKEFEKDFGNVDYDLIGSKFSKDKYGI